MPLSESDRNAIKAMFIDSYNILTIKKVFPLATDTTFRYIKENFNNFRLVRKPPSTLKRIGRDLILEPYMQEYLIELLTVRNNM